MVIWRSKAQLKMKSLKLDIVPGKASQVLKRGRESYPLQAD